MKAKILKTGKIVDLIGVSKEWGTATYWDENHVLRCDNLFGGIELLDDKTDIDWEERIFNLASNLFFKSLESMPTKWTPLGNCQTTSISDMANSVVNDAKVFIECYKNKIK